MGGAGVCPQPAFTFGKGGSAVPNPLFDEDCLQLNVWVPVGKPKDEKGELCTVRRERRFA